MVDCTASNVGFSIEQGALEAAVVVPLDEREKIS